MHFWTYVLLSFLIQVQNELAASHKYVFISQECPPTGESWYSFNELGMNVDFRLVEYLSKLCYHYLQNLGTT